MSVTGINYKPGLFLRRCFIYNAIYRGKSKSTAEYCLDSLKRYDYENFVCTLLLKNSARSCALAVRGFNVEVARVGEQVSDPKIGLMRMQFWEDTVDKCYTRDITKVPQHPVAMELYKILKGTKLTKRYFTALIRSRKERLSSRIFENLDLMEKYAEQSVSNVYYLILEGSGVRNIHADHAASHLGKAQGLVQQLRSIAAAKRLNTISMPQDLLAKHRVSDEDILRSKASERLNECVFEVACRAHQHLSKARSILSQVPSEGRGALLPAVVVENYLTRLEKLHYNILDPQLQKRSWLWFPKLWVTHFRNKY